MLIHDRGNKWHNYIELGFGLTINSIYKDNIGTIIGWELAKAPDQLIIGDTKEELIIALKNLIKEYNLKRYSKCKKDVLVIYTDNIEKVNGFLWYELSDSFNNLYCQLYEFIEIRPINRWQDLTNSVEIANYAQFLINELFMPNKYFYLTPNQVPRREIKKACGNDNTASKLFPINYEEYKSLRSALFGGIVYVPYKNLEINEPIMCIDLTSAYIYDLLIEKHCVTPFKRIDKSYYEFYLDSNNKTSLGNYEITYSCWSNKIHCFKTIDGKNFETGENTVICTMTSVDLDIFIKLANVKNITCNWLYESEIDTLPKYLIDTVVKQYIKKVDLVDDKKAYELQKPIVNGIFGDCIRKYDEKEFYEAQKKPSVAPQWGIWCTSYAKKNLLDLGLKVDGWVYSDTDSIYCYNTDKNLKLIEEYNNIRRKKIKEFCEKFNYDYEKLKDLGTFKVEKYIKRFKALAPKCYMYETLDGEFKLTAAGLNQKTITVSSDLFNSNRLDYGDRLFKFVEPGNYYEKSLHGEEALLLSLKQSSLMH